MKPRVPGASGSRWTPPLAVLAGAAILFFWWLGGHDLWAPDEPYFAEGAREMVVDGQWVVPHVNGVVTPDKPPLFFWCIALFSLLAGEVSSWTARLPSALAALGTLVLTMRLGRRIFGPRTAVLAGAVLATTFLFWDKARWSQTDSLLCLLIWLALSAFEAFRAGDLDGRRAGVCFWLAAGLAVLTKGPVGFLLPVGIALTVLATDRQIGRWRSFAPWLGPTVFAGVVGAWILATYLAGPEGYTVWGALREHFVDRGIHGLHHRQPPWYFLEALPPNLLPWLGLVPGALVLAWRRRRWPRARFALISALFVLVFFSISTEKRELYALPALPAFALMIAAFVAAVGGWSETEREEAGAPDRRWWRVGQGLLGLLLLAVAVALPVARARFDEIPALAVWILAGVLGGTAVLTLGAVFRQRPLAAALVPGAGFAVAYLVAVTAIYPALEPRKSARSFTLRIVQATEDTRAAGRPLVAYGLSNLPEHFAFYSDGMYTVELSRLADLERHLRDPRPSHAVVDRKALEALPEDLQSRLEVLDSTRLANREVLLVRNRAH